METIRCLQLPSTVLEDIVFDYLYGSHTSRLARQLEMLKAVDQPVQRSEAWYQRRYNMITASDIDKVIHTTASRNQLIYSKCQPLVLFDTTSSSEPASFRWGKKYEPVSLAIYKHWFAVEVDEFGCIPHPVHSFLGASPDGIVTTPSSSRYGRMLEIKNPISRQLITDHIKREYYSQIQLQLEVCDLPMCDFFETKFVEFDSFEEFIQQGKEEDPYKQPTTLKLRGMFIELQNQTTSEILTFASPLTIQDEAGWIAWREQIMTDAEEQNHLFLTYSYWKLDDYHLKEVPRDPQWFAKHLPSFQDTWNTIVSERQQGGFEARAPKKRARKETITVLKLEPPIGKGDGQRCDSVEQCPSLP